MGLDCLEHAPVREVRFASMAARLQARGASLLRACRARSELDAGRPATLDDVVQIEWRQRAAA